MCIRDSHHGGHDDGDDGDAPHLRGGLGHDGLVVGRGAELDAQQQDERADDKACLLYTSSMFPRVRA